MGRLSGWLDHRGLAAAELTPIVVEDFLTAQRRECRSGSAARRSRGVLMRVLRGTTVVPNPETAVGAAMEVLLVGYRAYLFGERGLAAESVRCYCAQTKKFLVSLPAPLGDALIGLDAAQVTAFVIRHSTEAASVWSAKAAVTGVRSLLRCLHVAGLIPVSLTAAVPTVASGGWTRCPAVCSAPRVSALLEAGRQLSGYLAGARRAGTGSASAASRSSTASRRWALTTASQWGHAAAIPPTSGR